MTVVASQVLLERVASVVFPVNADVKILSGEGLKFQVSLIGEPALEADKTIALLNIGAKFTWTGSLYNLLGLDKKKEYGTFLAGLEKGSDLSIGNRAMPAERLKTMFNNYFRQESESLHGLLSAKEDMGLEYALSQVFSPKQKELFLKKLKGEVLTKTEKEYFSRAVKKKVLALSNADLHRLSRKLLGE